MEEKRQGELQSLMQTELKGTPVSKGIAMGRAYLYGGEEYKAEAAHCLPEKASQEMERVQKAIDKAAEELQNMQAFFAEQDEDRALIFGAQEELLEDEELEETIRQGILEEAYTAEYAVSSAFSAFAEILSMVDDPLIAARTADLRDVEKRVLRILAGKTEKNLSCLKESVIIVARDLLPSDTAMLDTAHTLGIVTEIGSTTSHSAIIARSMKLPAVLGIENAVKEIQDGAFLVLDAVEGKVLLQPEEETVRVYEAKQAEFYGRQQETERYLKAKPCTKDGIAIELGLNIGGTELNEGYAHADFIGLFRSEFLYMESSHMPTEEEQFRAYRQVLEQAEGKAVTLRTLDIGGDKVLPYFALPKEENPFLGQRALRLCFANEDLFHAQLRAAYRASVYGNLQIMFPMVGSLEDFRRAKEAALAVRTELLGEGLDVPQVPLGVMIEVPSAAMTADLIAKEADFASVGTNDLCQYLCAADRMNTTVSQYYQSYSPAMLRTLKQVADAFTQENKPVCVCGEMGGDPMAAMLLIGLGWRKLSMSASNLAAVKEMICKHTLQQMEQVTAAALKCATEEEVKALATAALSAVS